MKQGLNWYVLCCLGVKSDISAIAALSCLILRKGIPPVPLPLATPDNSISFPLPAELGQTQKQAEVTSSDISSQQIPIESALGQSDTYEELHAADVPSSMSSALFVPCLPLVIEEDRVTDFLERNSDSDSNSGDGDDCSDVGALHTSIYTLNISCSYNSVESNKRRDMESSASDRVTADKAKIDLEKFGDYFQELDEEEKYCFSSQSLPYFSNLFNKPNEEAEIKGSSVQNPENIQCSESNTEELKDLPITIFTRSSVKSAIQFVEESLPQVQRLQTLSNDEPFYSKRDSVDR